MTTPSEAGDVDDADDQHPARPLWKEPPFLVGLVVLLVLLGVIGALLSLERDDEPDVGLLEPIEPLPSPTPRPAPSPEPSPVVTPPTPFATATPLEGEEPASPEAPELPAEDEDDPDIARGQEPDPVEVTGRRSGRTRVIAHEGGVAVIRLAHADEGSFRAEVVDEHGVRVAELHDDDGYRGVLVDGEGRYAGSRAVVLEEGGYRLQVVADGVWGMRWTQPDYVSAPELPVTRSAAADAARPFTVSGSRFEMGWAISDGEAVVRVINVAGAVAAERTVDDGETVTIGGLGGGIYLLDVRAGGRWRAELR